MDSRKLHNTTVNFFQLRLDSFKLLIHGLDFVDMFQHSITWTHLHGKELI